MKNFNKLLSTAIFIVALASCNESPAGTDETILDEKSALISSALSYPELTVEEETGILLMREEEKMAHDVYTAFSSQYGLPIFSNIASSENKHYQAIYTLISAYDLSDPSTGIEGTFTDPAIGELYNQLKDRGATSVEDALKTGAFIEEYDIIDLEKLIEATENPAIRQIYGNLLRGSRNHLRSFVSTLATYGITYAPELMDESDFEAVISSPMESGGQSGNKNSGKQGRGNRNGK